jgi:hypothetical protein
MPIIPATWEEEINRIVVLGKPGQKVSETLSQPTNWAWWFTFIIPATGSPR